MKQLSEMSVEELNQQQKSTKFVTGVMIGLLIGFAFVTSQTGFSMFTILPVFFLPLVLVNFSKLRKIKEELRLRR